MRLTILTVAAAFLTVAAAFLTTAAVVLVATVAAVISLARDEDAEPTCPNLHWDDETCPGCDPGPDDLEAVAHATGLIVWPAVPDVEALALAALIDRCIDRLVEGETCPDYYDEIKWGAL